MGMRIHVAVHHSVEVKELPFLNYKAQEFQDLLESMGCDVWTTSNEDYSNWEMEVPKKQFDSALAKLENWGALEKDDRLEIQHCLDACEFNRDEAIECFTLCQELGNRDAQTIKTLEKIRNVLKTSGNLKEEFVKCLDTCKEGLDTDSYFFQFW